jgi:hypothetical protein
MSSPDNAPKRIVNAYIDGFNLYHAIAAQKDQRLKWLNLYALAKSFLEKDEQIGRVVFFTTVLTWEREKQNDTKNISEH